MTARFYYMFARHGRGIAPPEVYFPIKGVFIF